MRYKTKVIGSAAVLVRLSDDELNRLVLANWHQFNYALKHRLSVPLLERLLRLEQRRGAANDARRTSGPRPAIVKRLTQALNGARTRTALAEVARG